MHAVILAGGLGTRLGNVIAGLNKPMAPVAGRPFLEYLLLQLAKNRVGGVTLCLGHRGDLIRNHFGVGRFGRMRLAYSVEDSLCGTAGALKLAEPLLPGENFLVLNGDSLFDIPLQELADFHHDRGALATLALAPVEDPGRFGTVVVDETGQVLRFTEKGQGLPGGLINAGVYVFRREVLARIPAGRPVSLEREVFPTLIGKGLCGLAFRDYFVDMGVPEDYARIRANPQPLRAAAGLGPILAAGSGA
jgi:NDP-sugar pyrophosphorylase family protein